MSHSAATPGERPVELQVHFENMEVQTYASSLGMWMFLATEVLLFGALFCGYAIYRYMYPEGWHEGSHHLNRVLGTINTLILIISSWAMVMGIHFARLNKFKLASICVAATIAGGLAFLVIHGVEYYHEFEAGALPGKFNTLKELHEAPGIQMFFTLYFIMTGLHSVHVIAGGGVLTWLLIGTYKGRYHAGYINPLENGGLYWHLVDLIWIFLFPLYYLV